MAGDIGVSQGGKSSHSHLLDLLSNQVDLDRSLRIFSIKTLRLH